MNLVFHGVLVGRAPETSLSMENEMRSSTGRDELSLSAENIVDNTKSEDNFLEVYDIIFAGVEGIS